MNDIIERAAKAIYYGTAGESDDRKGMYEADTGSHELCRDMAKAVFMAIREPSESMMAAGQPWAVGNAPPNCWLKMIDAALREDKS